MNATLIQTWIDALRSGTYRQTVSTLCRRDDRAPNGLAFCCLGVLSEISDVATRHPLGDSRRFMYEAPYFADSSESDPPERADDVLPMAVRRQIGMTTTTGNFDPDDLPDDVCELIAAEVPDWRRLVFLNERTDTAEISLTTLNDHGVSFATLARIIEARPRGLFVEASAVAA